MKKNINSSSMKKLWKKLMCIMILLLFSLTALPAEPCGDVNSDSTIDIVDALLIAQFYVDLDPQPFDQSSADVNGDSLIDILDALLVAQFYVNLIPSLPGCEPTPTPENGTPEPVSDRLRVIVSSDIGGNDPDDWQSMVHFLVYADLFDIEGILSSPGPPGTVSSIFACIDEYEKDYPNLSTYSSDYPTAEELRAITKQGALDGTGSPGYSNSTEGSNWIIECARRPDPRPVWILVWGWLDDVPQALHDAPDIESKLRVYWIGGPNKKYSGAPYGYLSSNFKNLWFIECNTTYRGMYNGGNTSGDLGNSEFVSQHVRGHGALGDLCYNKRSSLKMGDTPSFLYVLNNDVEDPTKPGWGGAFVPMSGYPNWWTDNPDPQYREGSYDGAKTVNIWREEYLRDWQDRMDRCQSPQ